MMFVAGDRIRYQSTGDDGLPLVRYGFVTAVAGSDGVITVMLDGEIGAIEVGRQDIQHVNAATVELRLDGADIVQDEDLRRGLLSLWLGEADSAGLDIDGCAPIAAGHHDSPSHWCLAELNVGGDMYVLRARMHLNEPDVVHVRAERHS